MYRRKVNLISIMANIRNNLSTIKIIQQNVLKWTFSRRNELRNHYMKMDPDIILLNSTGLRDSERIKIFNYNIYQRTVQEEEHARIAIAVKQDIRQQLLDNFRDDMLAIELETRKGPIIISTLYQPPRRDYYPTENLTRLMRKNKPVYILADINARHAFVGHTTNNYMRRILNNLIQGNIIKYLGPDFNTGVGCQGIFRPDIILTNRQGTLNYGISEGDLTTSDHIPIIFTISTTAIVRNWPPRMMYHRTNWQDFQNKVKEDMERLNNEKILAGNPRNVSKNIIDGEVEKWTAVII